MKDIWVLNAQTRNPDRPSLKYSSGGSGPLWKKNEAFCLSGNGGGAIYMRDRKEYLREYRKIYGQKNKEEIRRKAKDYYHKLGSPVREKNVLKNKLRRRRLREEAIIHYGGKCQCCGETTMQFLVIDHINGGGNKHRKSLKTRSIGEWLKANNYPSGFQTLCHNCNMAKSIYGKCPHKI